LYAGISSYSPEQTQQATDILKSLGTPCLIHQPNYNMFDRWIEDGLQDVLAKEGIGCICFSPLAQGLLTDKYLDGIPSDSRAAKAHGFLRQEDVTHERIRMVARLQEIAGGRGQKLAQMAISWVLRDDIVTSALIGASRVDHIVDAVEAARNIQFSDEEISRIDAVLSQH
ncbi:MAG: aldo/keto reductase, partial [Rhodothermia bacterium]|nr:aldo/keto reductase [Rhodothermia bacterium]